MKRRNYLIALLAVLAMIVAACGDAEEGSDTTEGGGTDTTEGSTDTTEPMTDTTGGGGDEDLVIGFSWNNFNEERWSKFDEPAFVAAIEAGGASYIKADAASSAEQQLTDVENLISQGADVIVILAQDTQAILPAVESAASQGIPVIAYDRLIEDERALYLTFDNIGVGRIMAEVLFEQVSEGNFAIIKGNGSDANSDFLRAGMEEVIGEAVTAGDITIVCEEYTDDWLAEVAQETMEQCLTQNNNDIQAALVENDGMAGGVVAALAAQGLDGRSRSPVRTAMPPPSTGSPSAPSWCRSGRTLASSGRSPVRPHWPSPVAPRSLTSPMSSSSSPRAGTRWSRSCWIRPRSRWTTSTSWLTVA